MRSIPIKAIPNQSFYINFDKVYKIALRFTGDAMVADITRNNEIIEQGMIISAFYPILPYQYLENNSGNFIFTTKNNDNVNFKQFGITQFLYYLTNEEINSLRIGKPAIFRVSDFSALGNLPLRYKPQGYVLA